MVKLRRSRLKPDPTAAKQTTGEADGLLLIVVEGYIHGDAGADGLAVFCGGLELPLADGFYGVFTDAVRAAD